MNYVKKKSQPFLKNGLDSILSARCAYLRTKGKYYTTVIIGKRSLKVNGAELQRSFIEFNIFLLEVDMQGRWSEMCCLNFTLRYTTN